MNAVEIEQAISKLADQPFDAKKFPYAFLLAFGNKDHPHVYGDNIKAIRTAANAV